MSDFVFITITKHYVFTAIIIKVKEKILDILPDVMRCTRINKPVFIIGGVVSCVVSTWLLCLRLSIIFWMQLCS